MAPSLREKKAESAGALAGEDGLDESADGKALSEQSLEGLGPQTPRSRSPAIFIARSDSGGRSRNATPTAGEAAAIEYDAKGAAAILVTGSQQQDSSSLRANIIQRSTGFVARRARMLHAKKSESPRSSAADAAASSHVLQPKIDTAQDVADTSESAESPHQATIFADSSSAEQGEATESSPHSGTRASVLSNDLGGFYRKLLGDDWQAQLEEMNNESNPLLTLNGEAADAAGAAGGTAAAATVNGSAAIADDELNLPDTYHGKTRQRIRRRDVAEFPKDISDTVADDLQFGEEEEPLITPEDISLIREHTWNPLGDGLPVLSEIKLGYHRAWDVGKKGCLAVKVDGLFDSAMKGNKMRFFLMDGTDPESFLSFYSKSDLQAARGLQSERLGTITAWDMRDGYWSYSKKKVFVKRSDVRKSRDCILEGFTAEFYDAMLLCIWEMCVQAATEQLKYQRRRERARRRQSLPLQVGTTPATANDQSYKEMVRSGRLRKSAVAGCGAETRRVSASLVTPKNPPRARAASPSAEAAAVCATRMKKVNGAKAAGAEATFSGERRHRRADAAAAAAHREVMRQVIQEGRQLLARPLICLRGRRQPRSAEGGGRPAAEEVAAVTAATATSGLQQHAVVVGVDTRTAPLEGEEQQRGGGPAAVAAARAPPVVDQAVASQLEKVTDEGVYYDDTWDGEGARTERDAEACQDGRPLESFRSVREDSEGSQDEAYSRAAAPAKAPAVAATVASRAANNTDASLKGISDDYPAINGTETFEEHFLHHGQQQQQQQLYEDRECVHIVSAIAVGRNKNAPAALFTTGAAAAASTSGRDTASTAAASSFENNTAVEGEDMLQNRSNAKHRSEQQLARGPSTNSWRFRRRAAVPLLKSAAASTATVAKADAAIAEMTTAAATEADAAISGEAAALKQNRDESWREAGMTKMTNGDADFVLDGAEEDSVYCQLMKSSSRGTGKSFLSDEAQRWIPRLRSGSSSKVRNSSITATAATAEAEQEDWKRNGEYTSYEGGSLNRRLSKYDSTNRVYPVQPQGSDTPLLTPDEFSPRETEADCPMFG